jgi:hypothetical protein
MNNKTKSLVRHILTALGTVLVLLGLGDAAGVIEFVNGQLDTVNDAILVIVGFLTSVFGFLREKDRLEDQPE